jgi:hypothetical protein
MPIYGLAFAGSGLLKMPSPDAELSGIQRPRAIHRAVMVVVNVSGETRAGSEILMMRSFDERGMRTRKLPAS